LKWWVVSVVAKFGLVMVGFCGGHLGVGWVSRWRSSLSHGGDWVFGFQLFLGLNSCVLVPMVVGMESGGGVA